MRHWIFILVLMLSGLSLGAQEVTVRQDTMSTRKVQEQNASTGTVQKKDTRTVQEKNVIMEATQGQNEEPSWGQFGELEADAVESLAAPRFTPIVVEPPKVPSWLYGGSSKSSYIGLGTVANVNMGYRGGNGPLSYSVGVGVDKYMFNYATANNPYFSGAVNYAFNENWSVSAFGQYAINPVFISMQAYPFVTTSRYGATINYQNDNWGMQLGARREFDPYTQRWEVYPVVVPTIRIGDVKVGVDVGPMMKQGYMMMQNRHNPPPPPPAEGGFRGYPTVRP